MLTELNLVGGVVGGVVCVVVVVVVSLWHTMNPVNLSRDEEKPLPDRGDNTAKHLTTVHTTIQTQQRTQQKIG